ncbi:adenine DNA glycosylase [Marinomonas agarivorans]|nr:adenine DNA glycosylase [Marinomonas agarivorans]
MTPINHFSTRVLNWFDEHGRKNLPWQQDKTPYRVWISEIMLQQTQVTTVIPYYQRFMASFPDVFSLAQAQEDDVLAHWSGLGYYARARNLHKTAKILADEKQGEFPTSVEGVTELPGIGRSTAAAILSISRGVQAAILDGNVKRVLSRLHAIDRWPGEKNTEKQLWELAEGYAPEQRCGDYTQAMMDLGATLCTRSKPQCLLCPLQSDCQGLATGMPTDFPVKKPKKAKPVKATNMLVLQNAQGQVLLEKRPTTGIWGGLWSLPESQESELILATEQRFQAQITQHQPLNGFRHTFSHYHLDIQPHQFLLEQSSRVADNNKYQWYDLTTALTLGLPAPIREILESLLKQ